MDGARAHDMGVQERRTVSSVAVSTEGSEVRQGRLGFVNRHPLAGTAAIATAVALGQAWWIWTHRSVGALDPDEAGYIASALRFERAIASFQPGALVHAVGASGTAPLLPLLSAPLVVVGPRDPRTVMLIQPLLAVLSAVAVSGIVRRLAGPAVAVGTGVSYVVLPAVLLATQSYWFGLVTAASMLGAVWALIESDRGMNARIWWFGVGVAAMLLSRTMALGFLPAMALAGVVVVGRNQRGLRRLAGAFALAGAIAGPWYFVGRESIFGYLFSYGYGPRAGLFGSGDPWERFGFRLGRSIEAVGRPALVTAAVVACVGGLMLWRSRRHTDRTGAVRGLVALLAVVAVSLMALVSTSNNGVWFELPVVAVGVAAIGALVGLSLIHI